MNLRLYMKISTDLLFYWLHVSFPVELNLIGVNAFKKISSSVLFLFTEVFSQPAPTF